MIGSARGRLIVYSMVGHGKSSLLRHQPVKEPEHARQSKPTVKLTQNFKHDDVKFLFFHICPTMLKMFARCSTLSSTVSGRFHTELLLQILIANSVLY